MEHIKSLSRLFFIIASSACCILPYSIASTRPSDNSSLYTLGDLEILEKEKNYTEFFAHARDVRPAKRTEYWKEMFANMAEGYAKSLLKKRPIERQSFLQAEKLASDWPHLAENEFFQKDRGSIAYNYFSDCLTQSTLGPSRDECTSDLQSYTTSFNSDFDQAKKFYQLIKDHDLKKRIDPWPYFSKALKTEISSFYCKEDLAKEVIFDKFADLSSDSSDRSELKRQLEKTISPACWAQIKTDLKQALSSSNRDQRQMAFDVLSAKASVSKSEKELYLTMYLLDIPVASETFDEAWNLVKQLGQNHQKRDKILNELKKLDPLPGGIFSSADIPKRDIILDYLASQFPEYLDFYAQTCLDYLKGKKVFPNGNPTVDCKDLMKAQMQSISSKRWIDDRFVSEFKKVSRL